MNVASKDKIISISERRKLKVKPEISLENVLNGKFMKEFESYAADQFTNRMNFRQIKAYTRFYILNQKDNNGIYIKNGFAIKKEEILNEGPINHATDRFNYIYQNYITKNNNVFLSIIPDKHYFTQDGYNKLDYEKMIKIVKNNMEYAEYIDVTTTLSIKDYYKTDLHFRQEKLINLANTILIAMGNETIDKKDFKEVDLNVPFYGVYYGQSALYLEPDNIKYLTNNIIEKAEVYNYETDKITRVYDLDKLENYETGKDLYDIFLSGASPLLTITNEDAKTDKELIVFRDSFSSSLAPLLIEQYKKITLIDIRYIKSEYLGEFVSFSNQDILFIYSTTVLNSASILK